MAHSIPLLACWESGEGVSGRDTAILSFYQGIGRRTARPEVLFVNVVENVLCGEF